MESPMTDVVIPGPESDDSPRPTESEKADSHDYTYSRLPSPVHFRLLKLYSSKTEPHLTCSLHVFELQGSLRPHFEAISYTWDPFNPRDICNIRVVEESPDRERRTVGELHVRRNLFIILRDLRTQDEDIWLWIDALCIDQAVSEERSQQVQLMGSIYSSAFNVVVCLSSEHNDPNIESHVQTGFGLISDHTLWAYRSGDLSDAFTESYYWKRKWVIQEILFARSVVLSYGGRTASMTSLQKFAQYLAGRRTPDKIDRFLLQSPMIRIALHRQAHANTNHPTDLGKLHDFLWQYRRHECTESADHIYALYNLIGPQRQFLEVNYEESPVSRYHSVMNFLRDRDSMPAMNTLSVAFLVLRLLGLGARPFEPYPALSTEADSGTFLAAFFQYGPILQLEESEVSIRERSRDLRLQDIPRWTFEGPSSRAVRMMSYNNCYGIESRTEAPTTTGHRLTSRVMPYFKLAQNNLYGFAPVPLQENDQIWHFWRSRYSFVVRPTDDGTVVIVGRTHMFRVRDTDGTTDWDAVMRGASPDTSTRAPCVVLNHADMFQLANWAYFAGQDDEKGGQLPDD